MIDRTMDALRRIAKQYISLWRTYPGAMAVLHITIVGGTICVVLLARDARIGLAAVLLLLAVLLAVTPVCAEADRLR